MWSTKNLQVLVLCLLLVNSAWAAQKHKRSGKFHSKKQHHNVESVEQFLAATDKSLNALDDSVTTEQGTLAQIDSLKKLEQALSADGETTDASAALKAMQSSPLAARVKDFESNSQGVLKVSADALAELTSRGLELVKVLQDKTKHNEERPPTEFKELDSIPATHANIVQHSNAFASHQYRLSDAVNDLHRLADEVKELRATLSGVKDKMETAETNMETYAHNLVLHATETYKKIKAYHVSVDKIKSTFSHYITPAIHLLQHAIMKQIEKTTAVVAEKEGKISAAQHEIGLVEELIKDAPEISVKIRVQPAIDNVLSALKNGQMQVDVLNDSTKQLRHWDSSLTHLEEHLKFQMDTRVHKLLSLVAELNRLFVNYYEHQLRYLTVKDKKAAKQFAEDVVNNKKEIDRSSESDVSESQRRSDESVAFLKASMENSSERSLLEETVNKLVQTVTELVGSCISLADAPRVTNSDPNVDGIVSNPVATTTEGAMAAAIGSLSDQQLLSEFGTSLGLPPLIPQTQTPQTPTQQEEQFSADSIHASVQEPVMEQEVSTMEVQTPPSAEHSVPADVSSA